MSTNRDDQLTYGEEFAPQSDYIGDDIYPNYILGNTFGGDTGNINTTRDVVTETIDHKACRFECWVNNGVLYLAPGTVIIHTLGKDEDISSIYPLFEGGPLNNEGETASTTISQEQVWVVLVYGGDAPEVKLLTDEEKSTYVEDNGGVLYEIAYMDLATVNVITSFNQGVPVYSSQLEAKSIDQKICSEIYITVPENESGDSDDSNTGSSKDSAILPVNWSPTGFAALYCVESPDVRFDDTLVVERPKGARNWTQQTCGRFRSVLADDTLEVVSYTSDKPGRVGLTVNSDGVLSISTSLNPFTRPNRLVVRLTGIRRGFKGVRLEHKTQAEYTANEMRLSLDTK